jgi:hypothetical protein
MGPHGEFTSPGHSFWLDDEIRASQLAAEMLEQVEKSWLVAGTGVESVLLPSVAENVLSAIPALPCWLASFLIILI